MQSNAIRLDFRSDTVTRPTAQMRAAMAAADVGDDVLGDDFTVQAVEARRVDVGYLAEGFDSVSLCLSKGLGAPLGSVLVGDAPLIAVRAGGARCSAAACGRPE